MPKDKESGLPKKYVSGLSDKEAKEKAKDIERRMKLPKDHPDAYNPVDDVKDGTKTKTSKHTKKYHDMFKEEKIKGLVNKSKETGVPYSILKQVYDRGMEAWRSGHRPGATQQQWAYARVNSFLTGGKTQKTTDADLWKQAKKHIKESKNPNEVIAGHLAKVTYGTITGKSSKVNGFEIDFGNGPKNAKSATNAVSKLMAKWGFEKTDLTIPGIKIVAAWHNSRVDAWVWIFGNSVFYQIGTPTVGRKLNESRFNPRFDVTEKQFDKAYAIARNAPVMTHTKYPGGQKGHSAYVRDKRAYYKKHAPKVPEKKFNALFHDQDSVTFKGQKYPLRTGMDEHDYVTDLILHYQYGKNLKESMTIRAKPLTLKEFMGNRLDETKITAADWENFITVAFNGGPEKDKTTPIKSMDAYNAALPTLQKIVQTLRAAGFEGKMIQTGSAKGKLHPNWKAKDQTPKADMVIGRNGISLKKKGGSQLMSAKKDETLSTFMAAIEMMDETSAAPALKLAANLAKLMQEFAVPKNLGTIGDFTQRVKAGDSKRGADAKLAQDYLDKTAWFKTMTTEMRKFFDNNDEFRTFFVYEAATGVYKFKPDPKASANYIVSFNESGKADVHKISNGFARPGPYISTLASTVKVRISWKTHSSKSQKTFPSFRADIKDSMDDIPTFQSMFAEHFSNTNLTEGIMADMIGKVKSFFTKVAAKVMQIAKKGLMAILRFFGIMPDKISMSSVMIESIERKKRKRVMDTCEKYTPKQLADLEKFGDRLLQKYGIDIEFTRHFGDRMSDPRNKPCIKSTELQQLFKKIQRSRGREIIKSANSQVVLNDLQSDLNLPVVIDVKPNGEFEVRIKTIMRKKDFKTPNKKIQYESRKAKYTEFATPGDRTTGENRALVDYTTISPAGKEVSVQAVIPPVTEKPAGDKYELNRFVNRFTQDIKKQGGKFQDVHMPGDTEHKKFFRESK